MAQLVRVDTEKHSSKMLSELHRMQQDRNHCDLIIKVQSDVYHAHKTVLSAGSEYFRAMLAHETKENLDGEITFKDVDSECVKNCIRFIYSGEFEIPNGKIKDLLHVAIMLQLDEVKNVISGILAESISADNYYSTRSIADMYELEIVMTKCQSFFTENLMAIANQPEFGNMAVSRLIDILRQMKVKYSEEEKLTMLLKWAEKNPKANNALLESIKQFKLDEISHAFLRNLLKSHPIISNDLAIYKWISDHLLETSEKIIKSYKEIACEEVPNPPDRQNAALISVIENKNAGIVNPPVGNRLPHLIAPDVKRRTAFLDALFHLLMRRDHSIHMDQYGFVFVTDILAHPEFQQFSLSEQEVLDFVVTNSRNAKFSVTGRVFDDLQVGLSHRYF